MSVELGADAAVLATWEREEFDGVRFATALLAGKLAWKRKPDSRASPAPSSKPIGPPYTAGGGTPADQLFDKMDTDGNGELTKFEFIEFMRANKPTGGMWSSVAKLQGELGLGSEHFITREKFVAAINRAASKGLVVTDFQCMGDSESSSGSGGGGGGGGGDPDYSASVPQPEGSMAKQPGESFSDFFARQSKGAP